MDTSRINFPWKGLLQWLHQLKGIPPLYIMAVVLYLAPNVLTGLLFLFPMLRRWIESSDWLIIRILLWWSQVQNQIIHKLLYKCNFRSCMF